MIHSKSSVKEVLNGDLGPLLLSFDWDMSPQGFDHWLGVYSGKKRLSKRSRRYLNKLLSS